MIELIGTKTDLGRFLDEFTPLIKGVLGFLLIFVLTGPTVLKEPDSYGFWSHDSILSILGVDAGWWAGWLVVSIWSAVVGTSVWVLSWLRSSVLGALIELDEDDDLGIQGFFSWIEDTWVITGTLVALFFPLIALAIYAATVIMLFLVHRSVLYIQEKRKIECGHCRLPIFSTALYCPSCYTPNMRVHQVGLFGQARGKLATDPFVHRYQLMCRRRCPTCATRLTKPTIQQSCAACGTIIFEDRAELEDYLARLRRSLPRTLLICLGLSFVPILGILPGVIYYRLALIASIRGYLRRPVVLFVRVGLLLFNLLLISVQWIPLFGALTIPIIGLTNYWVYRSMLKRAGKQLETQDFVSESTSLQAI